LAILLYTKSFVVYCLQAPLIFRHQQSCFLTSATLIIQICEQIILLKYSSLKRRQLREIDLTLLMEKRSIWEICSDRSQRDRSEIGYTWLYMESRWLLPERFKMGGGL